jgi:hypothetical protein
MMDNNKDEYYEFLQSVKPAVEFLKEHGNPDQFIVITMDKVRIMNINRETPTNYIIKTVGVK